MHRLLAALSLVSVLAGLMPLSAQAFDPILYYGDRIVFDVYRDGEPVGRHTVDFHRDGGDLLVDAELRLAVSFLGMTVYQFGYRSSSEWQDGRMTRLSVFVDDDGKQRQVSAFAQGDGMVVTGPKGKAVGPADLLPTDHWNPTVLLKDRVLNTLTGRMTRITITPGPEERVIVGDRTIAARRYSYGGGLSGVEVWYDGQGRWVRLRFPDRRDGVIEYRCVQCGRAGGEQG